METTEILAALDQEIARLQQVKTLLAGSGNHPAKTTRSTVKKRRILSPEARAKIAAAQRARWAKARKTAK